MRDGLDTYIRTLSPEYAARPGPWPVAGRASTFARVRSMNTERVRSFFLAGPCATRACVPSGEMATPPPPPSPSVTARVVCSEAGSIATRREIGLRFFGVATVLIHARPWPSIATPPALASESRRTRPVVRLTTATFPPACTITACVRLTPRSIGVPATAKERRTACVVASSTSRAPLRAA